MFWARAASAVEEKQMLEKKLAKGQVPHDELLTIKTAHDVRKLRACEKCGDPGMTTNMICETELGSKWWHGRCYADLFGLDVLLRLPPRQIEKLSIGDLGADLMRKVLEGRS